MQNSRKGFTLAEVLVTLAIIGVVAALTIPTLIQNTNNQRYATSLKKVVSMLNQAIQLSIANNGTDLSSLAATPTGTTILGLLDDSLSYLKTDTTTADQAVIWLADGSKIGFVGAASKTCGSAGVNLADPSASTALANMCYAIVDTNGDKGPNTLASATSASDVYVLAINNTSVVPVNAAAAPTITAGTGFGKDASGGSVTYTTATPGKASFNAVTGAT